MAESGIINSSYSPKSVYDPQMPKLIESATILANQGALARLLLMGKITKSTPTTGTAGTNTGNGTCASVTAGLKTKIGVYLLTCKSKTGGTLTVPTTGTKTGTGNGTMASVSAGENIKAGTYRATCKSVYSADPAAVAGFTVRDPEGHALPDAVAGTPYVNAQINFTITDGSSKFIVGDYFSVTASDGGLFSVKDPDGLALTDATVGVAYSNASINFTVADGSVDFAVGDTFTITVAAGSGYWKKSVATAVDGSQEELGFLMDDITSGSSSLVATVLTRGSVISNNISYDSSWTTLAAVKAALKAKGIYVI